LVVVIKKIVCLFCWSTGAIVLVEYRSNYEHKFRAFPRVPQLHFPTFSVKKTKKKCDKVLIYFAQKVGIQCVTEKTN